MKYLAILAAMSMVMFACSKDDENAPGAGGNGEASITFGVSAVNELENGMGTRAPLYSQEAVQKVTDVNVYAFKNNGTDYVYQATYNIPNWTAGTSTKIYQVPSASMAPLGDYKFLAIGRDANDPYTLPALTPATKFQDMEATVSASGNETEIFSGYTPVLLTAPGTFVNITMVRAVAGVLGYFKNVPAMINGTPVKYLRLSVSNSNQKVNLTTGAGINTTPAAFNIINLDLSGQTVSNNVYTGNDLSEQGVTKLPNSQLAGSFYIPVGSISMTLGLYDASNNPLKTWVVVSLGLPLFDILPNHFYSLGMKTYAGTTTGDPSLPTNPADPTDDDVAIDLTTDQTIIITIVPNWTLIHYLGILDNPI